MRCDHVRQAPPRRLERKKQMKVLKAAFMTGVAIYIWCLVWCRLELMIYGEIQPRKVDDIMTGIFGITLFIALLK